MTAAPSPKPPFHPSSPPGRRVGGRWIVGKRRRLGWHRRACRRCHCQRRRRRRFRRARRSSTRPAASSASFACAMTSASMTATSSCASTRRKPRRIWPSSPRALTSFMPAKPASKPRRMALSRFSFLMICSRGNRPIPRSRTFLKGERKLFSLRSEARRARRRSCESAWPSSKNR